MLHSVWSQVSVSERKGVHVCLSMLNTSVYYGACMFPHACVSLFLFDWLLGVRSWKAFQTSIMAADLRTMRVQHKQKLSMNLLSVWILNPQPHLSLSALNPHPEWTWNLKNSRSYSMCFSLSSHCGDCWETWLERKCQLEKQKIFSTETDDVLTETIWFIS